MTPDPVIVIGIDPGGISVPEIGSDPINLGPITPNIVLAALNGSGTPTPVSVPAAGTTLAVAVVGGEPITVTDRLDMVQPSASPSSSPAMSAPLLQVDANQAQSIEVRQPQVNQALLPGQSFGFALPSGIFSVSASATSTRIEVRQSNGRPLPTWMRYDAASGAFSGQAPAGQRQPLELTITIRDSKGNVGVSRLKVDFGDIQGALERPAKQVAQVEQVAGKLALAEQFVRYGQPDFERGVDALLGVSDREPVVG